MHEDDLDEDEFEEAQLKADAIKESQDKFRRDRAKQFFLEPALSFEEKFRKSCARVQWMKTRRDKVFNEGDPEYKYYLEAKRLLSKFEYHRKLQKKAIAESDKALYAGDLAKFKEHEKVVDKETMECLFYAHNIGKFFNLFKEAIGKNV